MLLYMFSSDLLRIIFLVDLEAGWEEHTGKEHTDCRFYDEAEVKKKKKKELRVSKIFCLLLDARSNK